MTEGAPIGEAAGAARLSLELGNGESIEATVAELIGRLLAEAACQSLQIHQLTERVTRLEERLTSTGDADAGGLV